MHFSVKVDGALPSFLNVGGAAAPPPPLFLRLCRPGLRNNRGGRVTEPTIRRPLTANDIGTCLRGNGDKISG